MTGVGSAAARIPSDHVEVPRPVDDQDLLQQLRAGEDAAFGELFARHSDAVRRLALSLAADRAEADDLCAEAFFRVLQAIRRGSGPVDNVRGYLLIVTRRVAWEWAERRRDVPVTDDELTYRVGSHTDANSVERALITTAFTSLPERWRSVLWKVEVEGERPAVVATNFGLSPNATAALARRARQGLRAAYLQAHLTVDRGATGCRSVLEKLGAYTAGSIKGSERRRLRAHLAGCPDCTAMHAELRDVCSGLRAHAAHLIGPAAAALTLVEQFTAPAAASGIAKGVVTVKGLLASAKLQAVVATSAAASVGVLAWAAGNWGTAADPFAADGLDGKAGVELVITGSASHVAPFSEQSTVVPPTGALSTVILATGQRSTGAGDGAGPGGSEVRATAGGVSPTGLTTQDVRPGVMMTYSQSSVYRSTEYFDTYMVVHETTEVTKVDNGTTSSTATSTTRTQPLYGVAGTQTAGTQTVGAQDVKPDPTDPSSSAQDSTKPDSPTETPGGTTSPSGTTTTPSPTNGPAKPLSGEF